MDEVLLLQDFPAERGQRLGACQKTLLKQIVTDFKALCTKQNMGPMELPDRARFLSTAINQLVPEWLVEARAVATAAEISAVSFIAMTSPPDSLQSFFLPKRANDSSAMAVTGTALRTLDLGGLLLENSDGPDMPHVVISRESSPGSTAYVALAEAANIGIKAFLNSAGLAGTFHIGPQVQDNTNLTFPPSMVLRHLCERATSCDQALAEFDALQKRIGIGTPDKRGTIYLFADATGEVLLLEASAKQFKQRKISNGFQIVTNKFQHLSQSQTTIEPFRQRCLKEQLEAGPVDLRRALKSSRIDSSLGTEKGVCDVNTRASFVAVTGLQDRTHFALATLGSPLIGLPVPIFPGIGIPKGMADGSAYAATRANPTPLPLEKRSAYDDALLNLLAPALSKSAQSPQLTQIMLEAWKLSREILAANVPQKQEPAPAAKTV